VYTRDENSEAVSLRPPADIAASASDVADAATTPVHIVDEPLRHVHASHMNN
jgi:hypothetical protein